MTLRQEVFRALKAQGFTGKDGVGRREGSGGFSLVVSTGPLNRRADISPSVGIRHDGIADLWYDLLELPRYEYSATIGSNVGFVIDGKYREWEPPATAEEVLGLIDLGFERLKEFMHLDRIRDGFEIPGSDMTKNYTLVLVELMRGDRVSMEREMEIAREVYCKHGGGPCEQVKQFESNLRERFPAGN